MPSLSASVLVVVTSHAQMGDTDKATGVWLEELAVPVLALEDAGVRVTVASVQGGAVPVDPRSRKPAGQNSPEVERFLAHPSSETWLAASVPLAEVDAAAYDGVFFPGGHGTMWDLPESELVAGLVSRSLGDGEPVAAVCHGPAALVGATDAEGKPVVAGRKVSAFTDEEEERSGLTDTVPFLLEARLREQGAVFTEVAPYQPHAVRDGLLVTGQNPASSGEVARLFLEALRESKAAAQPAE